MDLSQFDAPECVNSCDVGVVLFPLKDSYSQFLSYFNLMDETVAWFVTVT